MQQEGKNSYMEDERKNWTSHNAQNGLIYYYNKKENRSTWEKPKCLMTSEEMLNESDWHEYKTEDGKVFYHNKKTNKSQWNR